MQELSDFNLSQNDIVNKLQNQIHELEQTNIILLEDLKITKDHNEELLETVTHQKNKMFSLEEEMKKTIDAKNKLEKGLNHKLAHYKNKLEVGVIFYNLGNQVISIIIVVLIIFFREWMQ